MAARQCGVVQSLVQHDSPCSVTLRPPLASPALKCAVPEQPGGAHTHPAAGPTPTLHLAKKNHGASQKLLWARPPTRRLDMSRAGTTLAAPLAAPAAVRRLSARHGLQQARVATRTTLCAPAASGYWVVMHGVAHTASAAAFRLHRPTWPAAATLAAVRPTRLAPQPSRFNNLSCARRHFRIKRAMPRSVPAALLACVVGLALLHQAAAFDRKDYWWYSVCPGKDYAATPDQCEWPTGRRWLLPPLPPLPPPPCRCCCCPPATAGQPGWDKLPPWQVAFAHGTVH